VANVKPDFIPEGEEHKYPCQWDKKGEKRDFYPDEPETPAKECPPQPDPKRGRRP